MDGELSEGSGMRRFRRILEDWRFALGSFFHSSPVVVMMVLMMKMKMMMAMMPMMMMTMKMTMSKSRKLRQGYLLGLPG